MGYPHEDGAPSGAAGDWNYPADKAEREKARQECVENILRIEKEFVETKDSLFRQKYQSIEQQLEQLREGTHELYLKYLMILDLQKNEREMAAEQWRRQQEATADTLFDAEVLDAEKEFAAANKQLHSRYVKAVEEHQRRTSQVEDSAQFIDKLPIGTRAAIPSRLLPRRGRREKDASRDPKQPDAVGYIEPPNVMHTLDEEDILEDLHTINSFSLPPKQKAQRTS